MRHSVAGGPLLDKPEQQLYARLVRAFPGHVILAHVALAKLMAPPATPAPSHANSPATRTRWGVADFVVCKSDFTPLAVVECDDGDLSVAADRSRRRDQALQAAGLKVIRVAAADLPSESALRALVMALPLNAPIAPQVLRAS